MSRAIRNGNEEAEYRVRSPIRLVAVTNTRPIAEIVGQRADTLRQTGKLPEATPPSIVESRVMQWPLIDISGGTSNGNQQGETIIVNVGTGEAQEIDQDSREVFRGPVGVPELGGSQEWDNMLDFLMTNEEEEILVRMEDLAYPNGGGVLWMLGFLIVNSKTILALVKSSYRN
ncbi:unnamed protein product [Gordionus sp. m RMFG-2023]